MDAPRLTFWQILLPIVPFVAVIILPNLIFLDVKGFIENRPTRVTYQSADGQTLTESKRKNIQMVYLHWRLGPCALSTSTRTLSIFKIETGCSDPRLAVSLSLLRVRSQVTVALFVIAVLSSILIGRVSHWHSQVAVPNCRFYSPWRTVTTCLGILCLLTIGFAVMKPWWPAGVSELVGWLKFNVSEVLPFLSIVIIAPVSEELVFRSGLYRLLVEGTGPIAGVLVQALMFGSLHLATPLHAVVGFIGGVVLGLVYVYCRSLKASMVLHAGANGILAAASLIVA